jgi:hypothetical protein
MRPLAVFVFSLSLAATYTTAPLWRRALGAAFPSAAASASAAEAADALQFLLETRVCGSPAVNFYADTSPECLLRSPTARWTLRRAAVVAAGGALPPLEAHLDREADYDGLAVVWGVGHKAVSLEDCAARCAAHVPDPSGDGFAPLPCNAVAFCAAEVCWEPDRHHHTLGDCWLKFTEGPAAPEVNQRGALTAAQRRRHAGAPERTHWHGGVLLPPGVALRNGTRSPRWDW